MVQEVVILNKHKIIQKEKRKFSKSKLFFIIKHKKCKNITIVISFIPSQNDFLLKKLKIKFVMKNERINRKIVFFDEIILMELSIYSQREKESHQFDINFKNYKIICMSNEANMEKRNLCSVYCITIIIIHLGTNTGQKYFDQ